jgi:hypothetical protein
VANATFQLGSGRVSEFTINPNTGALTEIFLDRPLLVPVPTFVALDPSGKFAYVANIAGFPTPGSVWGYQIDPTTGLLTAIPGSPFPAGITPHSVAVTGCSTPPAITGLSGAPATLWPPNHKLVVVLVDYSVSASCGEPAVCTRSVANNEPVSNGDTSPDWVVLGEHLVELRAGRSGKGTGRIYTITISCKDTRGNSTSQKTTVLVPHDQGQ